MEREVISLRLSNEEREAIGRAAGVDKRLRSMMARLIPVEQLTDHGFRLP